MWMCYFDRNLDLLRMSNSCPSPPFTQHTNSGWNEVLCSGLQCECVVVACLCSNDTRVWLHVVTVICLQMESSSANSPNSFHQFYHARTYLLLKSSAWRISSISDVFLFCRLYSSSVSFFANQMNQEAYHSYRDGVTICNNQQQYKERYNYQKQKIIKSVIVHTRIRHYRAEA